MVRLGLDYTTNTSVVLFYFSTDGNANLQISPLITYRGAASAC